MDIRKYNSLDSYIHSISQHLSLKEDKRKIVNQRLSELLESFLLPTMKNVDEDFKKLFQKVHYSGSYYENLRICEPNEFDLNLELRSQKGSQKFFQIDYSVNNPGFVQMKYLSGDIVGKWINGSEFLMQSKVLYWLQGVVDKALCKIENGPWHRLWRKTSGPAVTLYVEYYPGEVFSVDLVPVFVMDVSQWPPSPVRQQVVSDNSYVEQWCVVPKPNNFVDKNGSAGTFWRMSFYNQERVILNAKNHLKNALKLMKLLRDEEGWHCLSSYYLNTVYLWTVMENDEKCWNSPIGVVFMNMLRTLKNYMKERKSIPFFWDERHNLLSNVNHAEVKKIGDRLERIIKDIDRNIDNNNPKYIITLFPTYNRTLQPSSTPPLSPSSSEENLTQPGNLTQTTQQASSIGWQEIALGVGALALAGTVLFKTLSNNRD